MMTFEYFTTMMIDLADTLGAPTGDKFNKRIAKYYDHLSRFELPELKAAFKYAESNLERFPPPKLLIELARVEKNKNPISFMAVTACVLCSASGVIKTETRSKGLIYRTIFKCPECDNCKANYPTWNENYRKFNYIPVFPLSGWNENDQNQQKGIEMLRDSTKICSKMTKNALNSPETDDFFDFLGQKQEPVTDKPLAPVVKEVLEMFSGAKISHKPRNDNDF